MSLHIVQSCPLNIADKSTIINLDVTDTTRVIYGRKLRSIIHKENYIIWVDYHYNCLNSKNFFKYLQKNSNIIHNYEILNLLINKYEYK